VLGERVVEWLLLASVGLSGEHIGGKVEVGVVLEVLEDVELVHGGTTASVDKNGIVFHLAEEVLVDHTLGRGVGGNVQSEEIRLGKNFGSWKICEVHFFVEAGLHEQIVDEDVHLEGFRPLCDKLADVSEADDSEGAALQPTA